MDVTIQVPFTIAALDGETPQQTAARVRLGLEAAANYINRVRPGRENAQVLDGKGDPVTFADDAERIAAIAALPQEAVVGIVLGELRAHISEMIVAEDKYRKDKAAEQANEATKAQVEASFG